MLRNPETAYLVSDEEFDRQLDELGWSTVDYRLPPGHVRGGGDVQSGEENP